MLLEAPLKTISSIAQMSRCVCARVSGIWFKCSQVLVRIQWAAPELRLINNSIALNANMPLDVSDFLCQGCISRLKMNISE